MALMARRARPRRALLRLVPDRASQGAGKLAKARGVTLRTTSQADVVQWEWPEAAFDVVVAIFVQFLTPHERRQAFAGMRKALKPGGLLLIEGYRPEQLNYKTGGPSQVENLYTRAQCSKPNSAPCRKSTITEHDSVTSEGAGHVGMAALIDLVGRK